MVNIIGFYILVFYKLFEEVNEFTDLDLYTSSLLVILDLLFNELSLILLSSIELSC